MTLTAPSLLLSIGAEPGGAGGGLKPFWLGCYPIELIQNIYMGPPQTMYEPSCFDKILKSSAPMLLRMYIFQGFL